MTSTSANKPLPSGIAVIHSNQLENLRDVVEFWLRKHPLAPLENEIFLVQSNGMGQWLKQNLADNQSLGIAASISVLLPSLFIWNSYRAVVGQQIPKNQLLAKLPLTWRLYRLLPTLIYQPVFKSLARFLTDDRHGTKRFQLAGKLADLFDQYQVYRSDWITDWANGLDLLRNAQSEKQAMPEQQRWQAALWRAILADLDAADRAFASRASVHQLFMQRIDTLAQRPFGIPRRLILFGLSSIPQQSLEVLAKLGKFCQIVLFVHNPCQHYWADIIEDKALMKTERRRQQDKPNVMSSINPETLPLPSHPLLAAWGKQGRDYIRMLDQFDETERYKNWHWPDNKIDFFTDYGTVDHRSLLQQLQQSILELEPTPAAPACLSEVDESLVFHEGHSAQREVEILHDQLLHRFNVAEQAGQRLHPRDVIVMVPDINKYAPHILAVFGQITPEDSRYIPFSLADQQQRGQNHLLLAVEALLILPESRFTVSEFLSLLESPGLRARFDIEEAAIPRLHQWVEESGIRWGFSAAQRAQAVENLSDDLSANTWHDGLKRMLLGYAVGAGAAFNGIVPYEEIGGLETKWLGSLAHLLESLELYAKRLQSDKSFSEWQQLLRAMLDDFFVDSEESESINLENLTQMLDTWGETCQQAGLTTADTLPLSVVREAWLSAVDEPTLQQRFLSGRVNFCTLMPMRAIPFRVICLLGMNDGDYPRSQPIQSFDLMGLRGQYRFGDRSRRQDDQYLFLEALMSAREQLYISWVGRNNRDNSIRPPSVLISQLREFIALGWRLADNEATLLSKLTVAHPLQPFSRQYLKEGRDAQLYTYAREWFEASLPVEMPALANTTSHENSWVLSIESVARFLMAPVKTYCQQTLKMGFDTETVISKDNEPFVLDALDHYLLTQELLNTLKESDAHDFQSVIEEQQAAWVAKGKLPLGPFSQLTSDGLTLPVAQAWKTYQTYLLDWPTELTPEAIDWQFTLDEGKTVQLTGQLNKYQNAEGSRHALLFITPQSLLKHRSNSISFHKLLPYWVQHLAACTQEKTLQSFLISPDTVLEFMPIATDIAHAHLHTLVNTWCLGMQSPLPIACRTAFAYLAATPEKALEAAKLQYEGDDWNAGEIHYDPYLGRLFPHFSDLYPTATPQHFEYWLAMLYQPVFENVKKRVVRQDKP